MASELEAEGDMSPIDVKVEYPWNDRDAFMIWIGDVS